MDMNAVTLIRQNAGYMNSALKKIAEYILSNLEESKTITTRRLATVCGVAESTVTRFVRELGFHSFQEMKISIAEYLTQNQPARESESERVYEDIGESDSIADVIEKLVYRNVLALTETQRTLNTKEVERAVDIIEAADTLIFCCQGFSRVAALEGVTRFTRAGKKCILFEDESMQLMMSAIAGPRDAIIGISNTGRTGMVISAMRLARENKRPTICITSFEGAPIVKAADVSLITPTKSRHDETGTIWESASSKTAQVLVIDILCACFTLRQYKKTLGYMDATYRAIKSTRVGKDGE